LQMWQCRERSPKAELGRNFCNFPFGKWCLGDFAGCRASARTRRPPTKCSCPGSWLSVWNRISRENAVLRPGSARGGWAFAPLEHQWKVVRCLARSA
ncbi:unnamed protein product, partial [Polarella glacialis]